MCWLTVVFHPEVTCVRTLKSNWDWMCADLQWCFILRWLVSEHWSPIEIECVLTYSGVSSWGDLCQNTEVQLRLNVCWLTVVFHPEVTCVRTLKSNWDWMCADLQWCFILRWLVSEHWSLILDKLPASPWGRVPCSTPGVHDHCIEHIVLERKKSSGIN